MGSLEHLKRNDGCAFFQEQQNSPTTRPIDDLFASSEVTAKKSTKKMAAPKKTKVCSETILLMRIRLLPKRKSHEKKPWKSFWKELSL
jgi:hypothetical protein